VWALKGTRPLAIVRQKYEWLYVYAFLHPSSGDTHWLLLPTVNIAAFTAALADFAKQVGLDRRSTFSWCWIKRAGIPAIR